ncbi:MAG TPA: type II toxin-antitoxin system VapB family antitoxin [Beijerinckiaceae bacterium]|jgi:hypothetical protein|nr:type II toxin-antitoxin system VapB family antitoxin [Beijerinckiaceae bacterium]
MVRQLNIRSDEAFETARTLAKHFGRTTTEIVIDALREYRSRRLVPSQRITKEEAEEGYRILKEAAKEFAAGKYPGATSDHSDMYDEHGLPK